MIKFPEISVIPAASYAVRRAYVTDFDEVNWPGLCMGEGETGGLVACIELMWSFQLIRKKEPSKFTPPDIALRVMFARKET